MKNAYDADATEVQVFGERLHDPGQGRIVVKDNGVGMTSEVFEAGFLRVASRLKEQHDQRSPRFGRRFTGAKGIGRLAAHKLARDLEVTSVPWIDGSPSSGNMLHATIEWDKVEARTTLDELEGSDAITLATVSSTPGSPPGTTILLSRLRRAWTPEERARFFAEVQSFDAPEFLKGELPKSLLPQPLLFPTPSIRETVRATDGSNFAVRLEGDFAAGEEYWQVVAQTATWVLEIRASRDGQVAYAVAPGKTNDRRQRGGDAVHSHHATPFAQRGPFFRGSHSCPLG